MSSTAEDVQQQRRSGTGTGPTILSRLDTITSASNISINKHTAVARPSQYIFAVQEEHYFARLLPQSSFPPPPCLPSTFRSASIFQENRTAATPAAAEEETKVIDLLSRMPLTGLLLLLCIPAPFDVVLSSILPQRPRQEALYCSGRWRGWWLRNYSATPNGRRAFELLVANRGRNCAVSICAQGK